jgi:PAS domain S-box-containing protein
MNKANLPKSPSLSSEWTIVVPTSIALGSAGVVFVLSVWLLWQFLAGPGLVPALLQPILVVMAVTSTLFVAATILSGFKARRLDDTRRRYEVELQANAQQLQQFFDLAPIGKTITTLEGRYTRVNRAFCELVGYTEEELLNQTFLSITHPDDIVNNKLLLQQMLNGEITGYHYDKRYLHKDGRPVYVSIHSSLLLDRQGRPAAIVGQAIDISNYRQAEDILRRQNEYLSALHETSLGLINNLEITQLLEAIMARVETLFGTPHAYIDVVSPDQSTLETIIGRGMYAGGRNPKIVRGEGVGGRVWETGQPLAIDDYTTWPGRSPQYQNFGFHALVGVPLKARQQVVGVLGLARTETGQPFSVTQVEMLERFAEIAGLALDNARLYSAAQAELAERKRSDSLRATVFQISQAAGKAQSLSDLFQTVHNVIQTVMPANNFYIALYDPNTELLSFPYFVDEVDVPVGPQKLGTGLTDYVLRTGQPLFCTKEKQAELERAGAATVIGVDSPIWLGVPLIIDNKTIGAMVVQHYTDPNAYTPADLQLLEFVSSEVARSIDRKRAADDLQRERDFALQVMHALGQGVTVSGPDGLYEYVNQAFSEMVGYQPEEIIGHLTPKDLTTPDDHPIREEAQARRKRGETNTYEVRLVHRSGTLVPVLITDSPRWQDGQVIGAVTVVTDLTNRKEAEDALQQSEARFRVLAENIPGVVYQCRNDDRYTLIYINDAVETLTGYPRSLFVSGELTLMDLYHPDEKVTAPTPQNDRGDHLQPRPFHYVYRIRHRSGDWRWVEEWGTAVFDANNVFQFFEGFISDITESKQAEAALRQSEERFRVLAENIPGVIFQCQNDDRHTFLYLNDGIADLTGYPKEDFLRHGLSFFDLYHPADLEWMPVPSQTDAKEIWEPYHMTYRIKHRSGEWRWIEEWGTPIVDPISRQPKFLEGFMIDITERKRADEMLARNARQIEALDHMGQAVAATLDLPIVLKKVVDEITPLLQAEGMSVLLPEGEDRLVFSAASGPAAAEITGQHIPRKAGIVGQVMSTGQSILFIGDAELQLYRDLEQVSHYHTRSLLAVPLILAGEVIGVMEAVHTQVNAFTLEDQRLLEAAANWAAIAIGNARQHARIQRRLHEGETMAAISRALNETLDLPVILQLIADSARQVIPITNRALVSLFDETSQLLRPAAASGQILTSDDLHFRPGQGILGRVFAEGRLLNIGDISREPNFVSVPNLSDPKSLLSVPVQSAHRRLGVLSVSSDEPFAFSTDDERLLINLSVQAALAIENARLYNAARRRAEELNIASEILRTLNAATAVEQVFGAIAVGVKSIAQCDRVSLGLYDEAYEWYTIAAVDQPRAELAIGSRLKVDKDASISRDILLGQIHYTPNLELETGAPGIQDLLQAGYRSRVNLPLKANGVVVGSLNLNWTDTDSYLQAPLPLLEQIADAIALAIAKTRLLEKTTEALSREQGLNKIARTISGALGLSSILESVTRLTAEVTGADAASLALLNPERQLITAIHTYNFVDFNANVPLTHGHGVAWEIIDSGKPLLLADYSAHPYALPDWIEAGAKAFLGVPIMVGQETLGILGLFRLHGGQTFASRDVELAESIGFQAGVAIQNARLFEALSQEKRQIELLHNLGQTLTKTLDPHEVANQAIQLTIESLGLELGSINLLEQGTDRIHIFAMTGFKGESLLEVDRRAKMQIGHGLGGQVALTRRTIIAPDLANDPYWNFVPGPDDDARSAVCAPLLVGDELIGVMILLSKRLNAFTEQQLPFLNAVASSVALSLQNARRFEIERSRVAALTALHEIGLELSTELDLATLLRFIVERAVRLLNAPMGALSLLRPEIQTLELVVSYNLPDRYVGTQLKLGEGATGIAAATGQPLIVDDYEHWEQRAPVYYDAPFRSIVSVPIKWRGQVLGVISANHVQPFMFAKQDAELVNLFADQAAVAIANARQHQELQRQLQESDAIARISRALNETLDLQRLLTLIVEAAHRILPNVQRAVIHLLDKDGQTLRPAAVSGEGESAQSVIMRPGEGVAGQVIAQGIVINVADTLNDPRYLVPDRASRTRSMLVAPVQSGLHRLGTLSVNSITSHAFSADDERLLATLGTQAALAIYNAQLFEDTRRQLDELVLLNTIALVATEATTEDELIKRATRLIEETFFPISVGTLLIDDTGNYLIAHPSYRHGPPGSRIRLNDGITGRVAATGQPWLVPDVQAEPAYLKTDANIRSELCVPLKAGNIILGVVNAESERVNAFSETDFRLFTTLAGQLATAIQKLRFFRELEHALKQEKATRAQLVQSEKLAAMGRLVASVAHELNNPLQAIQNALYLIRQESALSVQAIEDLQVASTESDRMADLINRLRETYRPATSEEFRFESLNSVVVEVQKLIATHLRHNNIEFKFDPDPGLPYIPAVRDQLKQVLLNLSLNAVEAMPAGGELYIRTKHDPATNYVILTIHDTGLGIASDILPNVFDPFFTTKETGTGLGLTITYDIIQRHNGRVEISSQPKQGTTFTIWLPTVPPTKSK